MPFDNTRQHNVILTHLNLESKYNKAGYTATLVACGWGGAVLEKVSRATGQELHALKAQKRRKSNKSSKDRTWTAVPVALLGQFCLGCGVGAGQRPQRADVL